MHLTAEQARAARGLLNWSQSDLANTTRLSMRTIKRLEAGEVLTAAAELSIRTAFAGKGIVFVSKPEDLADKDVIAGVALVRPL